MTILTNCVHGRLKVFLLLEEVEMETGRQNCRARPQDEGVDVLRLCARWGGGWGGAILLEQRIICRSVTLLS